VTPQLFVLFLALGAALIAIWIDFRLPRLAPANLRATFVHAAAAFVALAIAPLAADSVFSPSASFLVRLAALLGIVFPVLVYAFLALGWLMKPLARGLAGR
jgi:hypothetical protein